MANKFFVNIYFFDFDYQLTLLRMKPKRPQKISAPADMKGNYIVSEYVTAISITIPTQKVAS